MLTTLAIAKSSMQIPAADTSTDAAILEALLPVDRMIKSFLRRNVEQVGACVAPTQQAVVAAAGGYLPTSAQYWVITAYNNNGETLASNEVTLTPSGGNLSATLSWFAVTNAIGYCIYRGTSSGNENVLVAIVNQLTLTYTDVGSTQASQSPPAVSSATAGFTEYVAGSGTPNLKLKESPVTVSGVTGVWIDPNGFGGQASGAFAANTLQVAGVDYYVDVDQPDGQTSNAGILVRIGGLWQGAVARGNGRLVANVVSGQLNVKVAYQAGWSVIPYDIQKAANLLIAKCVQIGPEGYLAQSESFESRSVSLQNGADNNPLITPDIVGMLIYYQRARR